MIYPTIIIVTALFCLTLVAVIVILDRSDRREISDLKTRLVSIEETTKQNHELKIRVADLEETLNQRFGNKDCGTLEDLISLLIREKNILSYMKENAHATMLQADRAAEFVDLGENLVRILRGSRRNGPSK